MIIVAGHLRVAAGDRESFLGRSREAIRLARRAPGCHDFVVAADPVDAERVNVYERWTDRAALYAFRGDGPDDELGALIVSADIVEFDVLATQTDA
jgi:quinol monooxygenase YgiN